MRNVVQASLIALAMLPPATIGSAASNPQGTDSSLTSPVSPFDLAGAGKGGTARQFCRLGNPRPVIRLDGGSPENCGDPPANGWTKGSLGALDLFVHLDGPEGSGRYWRITIGVAKRNQPVPARRTCLTTSTVGWRTLRNYNNRPLPWHRDLDNDGKAELIIWDSFPLHKDASNAETGLTAWVYRYVGKNEFAIDWRLSRQMARETANAYRAPFAKGNSFVRTARTKVAQALQKFSNKQCVLNSEATP